MNCLLRKLIVLCLAMVLIAAALPACGGDGGSIAEGEQPTGTPPGEPGPTIAIIVDNAAPGFTIEAGEWDTCQDGDCGGNCYGADFRFAEAGCLSCQARFDLNVANAGDYDVYAWWPSGEDRATDTPFTIEYSGGVTTIDVDQQNSGDGWYWLDMLTFQASETVSVRVEGSTTGYANADAIALTPAGAEPPTAPIGTPGGIVSPTRTEQPTTTPAGSPPGTEFRRIIFIHHSCGANLIEQGDVRRHLTDLGYEFYDHGYNEDGLVTADGTWTGENFDVPGDNTDPDGYATIFSQPLHDPPVNTFSHLMRYDVIAFKSCFPVSNIQSDEQLAEYKSYYLTIRDRMDDYLNKVFIVMTQPPEIPADTDASAAARARELASWLASNEYLAGHPNVFTFDFFDLLADPSDNMLRVEYRLDEYDAHPNELASRTIGPVFADFIDQAIDAYAELYEPEVSLKPTVTPEELTHTSQPTPNQPPPSTPAPSLTRSELIQPSDLTYLGAFRLPDEFVEIEGDQVSFWSYSGGAMTYYPGGDPSGANDGFPGSLFAVGHDQSQYVSEISISAPIISKNLSNLNTAVTLQGPGDITGGMFGYLELPTPGLAYLPAQGMQTTDKLHFCWGQHFQGDEPSHGWCELDLSNPRPAGPWHFGGYTNYVTNDYLFEIPEDWAAVNTPGQRLVTGRFREGYWTGLGPTMFAYGPWNDGNPPDPNETLATITPLLLYGIQEPGSFEITISDSMMLQSYKEPDQWAGGVWLTADEKSAVVFVGTKATGDCWYGFSNGVRYPLIETDDPDAYPEVPPWPHNDRGFWSDDIEAQIIFYNPGELAAVARDQMETWEPQPYASMTIDEYLIDPGFDPERGKRHLVGAASFDRERGLLYVIERMADEDEKSLIHVWRIGD